MSKFEHILIAYDDSEPAERALNMVIDLAVQLQSRVTVVTILEPLPGYVQMAAVESTSLSEKTRGGQQTR